MINFIRKYFKKEKPKTPINLFEGAIEISVDVNVPEGYKFFCICTAISNGKMYLLFSNKDFTSDDLLFTKNDYSDSWMNKHKNE